MYDCAYDLKRVFKNECPGVLFGRPRRRPRREFAERDAGVVFYGRHVLAHRVLKADEQFEVGVLLLHLRLLLSASRSDLVHTISTTRFKIR